MESLDGDNFSDPGKIFDLLVPHVSSSPPTIIGDGAMTSHEHQHHTAAERAGMDGRAIELRQATRWNKACMENHTSGSRPPL